MKSLRVSDDIVTVSEFKAHTADMLERLAGSDHPIVLTQNGKAAGVLLSPLAFDALSARLEVASSVAEGLADVDRGAVVSQEDAKARLVARAKGRRAK